MAPGAASHVALVMIMRDEKEYSAVISLGAGTVSFTHIVSAIMMGLYLKTYYSPQTYLSLLPIVGGVALVSLKELLFAWLGFAAAVVASNSPGYLATISLLTGLRTMSPRASS